MKLFVPSLGLALALACASAFSAQGADPASRERVAASPADPVVRKTSPEDRKLLSKVRRAILHDKTLSRYAHTVSLSLDGGTVTITGEVRNAAERRKVEAIAAKVPGIAGVDNRMTVIPAPVAKAKPAAKRPRPGS